MNSSIHCVSSYILQNSYDMPGLGYGSDDPVAGAKSIDGMGRRKVQWQKYRSSTVASESVDAGSSSSGPKGNRKCVRKCVC